MTDAWYEFIYTQIESIISDSILYGSNLNPVKVESNLVSMKVEGVEVTLDFKNGKIEKVWMNGQVIPLSIKQRLELTILAII